MGVGETKHTKLSLLYSSQQSVFLISSQNSTVHIANLTFLLSTTSSSSIFTYPVFLVASGGLILSNLSIQPSHYDTTSSTYSNSLLISYAGTLTISNCIFSNLTFTSSSALYIHSDVNLVNIGDDTVFDGILRESGSGGVVDISLSIQSTLSFSDVTFMHCLSNSTSAQSGALYILVTDENGPKSFSILDTHFTNCTMFIIQDISESSTSTSAEPSVPTYILYEKNLQLDCVNAKSFLSSPSQWEGTVSNTRESDKFWLTEIVDPSSTTTSNSNQLNVSIFDFLFPSSQSYVSRQTTITLFLILLLILLLFIVGFSILCILFCRRRRRRSKSSSSSSRVSEVDMTLLASLSSLPSLSSSSPFVVPVGTTLSIPPTFSRTLSNSLSRTLSSNSFTSVIITPSLLPPPSDLDDVSASSDHSHDSVAPPSLHFDAPTPSPPPPPPPSSSHSFPVFLHSFLLLGINGKLPSLPLPFDTLSAQPEQ